MDWLKGVKSRHLRTPELDSDLASFFIEILNNAEDIRPRIRSYRKFLDNNSTLFPIFARSVDITNTPTDSALTALLKTQEDIYHAQRDSLADDIKILIVTLRAWEDHCDLLLKMKFDLQKALMDMNKLKDKLRQSRELDASKIAINNSEFVYTNQKEALCLELHRYYRAEIGYQEKVVTYLTNQLAFLQLCKERAEANLNVVRSISESPSKSYFGTSLLSHLDKDGYSVVLKKCLSYLIKNQGYRQEGIFRISGQATLINILRDALDKDKADGILDLCDVYVVADVMKQYLRDLREPLLSGEFMESWPSETPNSKKVLSIMHDHLLDENRKNLILLLQFLVLVQQNEGTSKMSPDNLAVTLCLNLCPKSDFQSGAKIIQYLVKNADKLLDGEKDINAILEAFPNTSATVPPPLKTLPIAPQVPDRTYQGLSRNCGGEGALKPRAPPPPIPHLPAQGQQPSNHRPHVPANEIKSPPVVARQASSSKLSVSNSGGNDQCQEILSAASVPVTAFDSSNCHSVASVSVDLEERNSKVASQSPSLSSDTTPVPEGSDKEPVRSKMSSFQRVPDNEKKIEDNKTGEKVDNEQEKESESDTESSESTYSEKSTTTDTSTTDSSAVVLDKRIHAQEKNRELKSKKESLKSSSLPPSPLLEHTKVEEEDMGERKPRNDDHMNMRHGRKSADDSMKLGRKNSSSFDDAPTSNPHSKDSNSSSHAQSTPSRPPFVSKK